MILIFGSHGYMGSAIAAECDRRGVQWVPGSRRDDLLIQAEGASLVINAAAFIPKPSVIKCESFKIDTLCGNVMLPFDLVSMCKMSDIPIIHLSTGCLFDEQREYTENDKPTRGWDGHCGFYVGTKLLAEELVREYEKHYILRLRLPFDEVDHPKNYLTKLTKFETVFDHTNSLTHRGDFSKWVLDLWEKRAPFGTYHCVNEGQVSARQVLLGLMVMGMIEKCPDVQEHPTTGARLSCQKLKDAGVQVRSIDDAMRDAWRNWKPCTAP